MYLSSVMISISWVCDFHVSGTTRCPYCWVSAAGLNRKGDLDHSAEEWLQAIRNNIPETATLDFVGGEPTLFPEFYRLVDELSNDYRWAVTSNMGGERWKTYKRKPLKNGISWTASYHPSGCDALDDFSGKCLELSPHYPMTVNIVDFHTHNAQEAAIELQNRGLKVFVSPFEDIRSLNRSGPIPLSCNAGHTHLAIDPQGFVYGCLTQLRRKDRERWRLGNIFDGGIFWPKKRRICFIPCDQYYVLDPKHSTKDMYELDVREIEISDSIDISSYRNSFDISLNNLGNFPKSVSNHACVSTENR